MRGFHNGYSSFPYRLPDTKKATLSTRWLSSRMPDGRLFHYLNDGTAVFLAMAFLAGMDKGFLGLLHQHR